MIKVIAQSNGKQQKEMSFKDKIKALRFMYMCATKGMFILSYYGETEWDDMDIWWLNNRVDLAKLNGLARLFYEKGGK